ncbi:MAG: FAD-dependent oxidoreductase [Bacteroidia bacterium]|nr:FAD-dependent oxidoreductase [Bacteroidia bacterium]
MANNTQHIIIIGGGPAGLEAASSLGTAGYKVTVFEKEEQTGGKLRLWYKLFPGFRLSGEVKSYLANGFKMNPPEIITNAEVVSVMPENNHHKVILTDGQSFKADVVLIASGFQVFNAEKKEEYGYKIYDNVITSVDLEELLKSGNPIKTLAGKTPEKIAFIHCVGSRDKKVGNIHCSRVCCITGVKQAIEMKHNLPEAEIFNFYMDMRMFGQNYEELYLEAQQKWGITFIRGRVSEIAENIDGTLQLKAEDTLSERPMKMNFDLVVLLVGMVPTSRSEAIGRSAGLAFTSGNFLATLDTHICQNETNTPGIFVTGTCKEPLSIAETLTDARAATVRIMSWLRENELKLNN